METVKPTWKTEGVKGKITETKFDKWTLLAQVVYQIVVWDTPITKKLQRTQELLSNLTPEEKQMFQIIIEDEEGLNENLDLVKYYGGLLARPEIFVGEACFASKVLTEEEKRVYLTRPRKEPGGDNYFYIHWNERALTVEGEELLKGQITGKRFTLFGVEVDSSDVYCKLKSFEPKNDGWNPGEDDDDDEFNSLQSYRENRKLDFGKDDPLVWRVDFYVQNAFMLPLVKRAFSKHVLTARNLIGSILQRMMKQLEGKTVYVIPEERVIP